MAREEFLFQGHRIHPRPKMEANDYRNQCAVISSYGNYLLN